MNTRLVTVSIDTPEHGRVVKRVRVNLLRHYEAAGWHTVPRRRFKVAKRAAERRP